MTTAANVFLGCGYLGGYGMEGKIGMVVIYKRALTPGKVAALYADPWAMFRSPRAM